MINEKDIQEAKTQRDLKVAELQDLQIFLSNNICHLCEDVLPKEPVKYHDMKFCSVECCKGLSEGKEN